MSGFSVLAVKKELKVNNAYNTEENLMQFHNLP